MEKSKNILIPWELWCKLCGQHTETADYILLKCELLEQRRLLIFGSSGEEGTCSETGSKTHEGYGINLDHGRIKEAQNKYIYIYFF